MKSLLAKILVRSVPLTAIPSRFVFATRRGMTLLELLVVMVILGILATIGTLQVVGYLDRSRVDAARLQMDQLATAINLFRIDMGRVPAAEEGLEALIAVPHQSDAKWRGPYLTKASSLRDPWGRAYIYSVPGKGKPYDLSTLGADGKVGGTGENEDLVHDEIGS